MNKFTKFGAAALLAVFLTACGPEPKAEFQQVISLDQEFAPALVGVQQKIIDAQSKQDQAGVQSAVNEYFTVMDNAIKKYNSLNIKDAEVKAFKDQVVKVLQETVDFTKEATSAAAKPEALTPELQQKIIQQQATIAKNAEALQKTQNQLSQKFSNVKK